MLQTPRPVGRPKKKGERKKTFGIAIVPSRINALDYLVEHFNADSRGDLLTQWIDREIIAIFGEPWNDEQEQEAAVA